MGIQREFGEFCQKDVIYVQSVQNYIQKYNANLKNHSFCG